MKEITSYKDKERKMKKEIAELKKRCEEMAKSREG